MSQDPKAKLEFTGERFTPECVREIYYEHVHRYALAAELVHGKKILDAACGEGYGSAMLSRTAKSVHAVDLSAQAIAHAKARYADSSITFVQASVTGLPFEDNEFECIVSFETLEHLHEQEQMLREFRRVLAPDGFLMVSSPDKAIYTDKLANQNEFHVRELYRAELTSLLAGEFPAVRLLGQKLAFHSVIWTLDGEQAEPGSALLAAELEHISPDRPGPARSHSSFQQERGDEIIGSALPVGDAVYFIALCAQDSVNLPALPATLFLFDDHGESVLQHYHHEIRKNMQAGALIRQRDEEISALQQQLQEDKRGNGKSSWWRRWFAGD